MHTDSPTGTWLRPGRTKNKTPGSCAVMDQIFSCICTSNKIYFLCPQRYTTLKTLAFSAENSNVGTEPLMPGMRVKKACTGL